MEMYQFAIDNSVPVVIVVTVVQGYYSGYIWNSVICEYLEK